MTFKNTCFRNNARINLLGVRFHPTATAPEMSYNDLDVPSSEEG